MLGFSHIYFTKKSVPSAVDDTEISVREGFTLDGI